MAALLLLGLWAACSVNCAFENLARVESLTCCSDEGGGSEQTPVPASQCACSVLASGAYVPHSNVWLPAVPPDAVLASFGYWLSEPPMTPVCVAGVDASPPELAGSWQFIVRTALPARPPSLVS